jgi:hypothetical protein
MTRRPRRNHTPAFKAKVAIELWLSCRSDTRSSLLHPAATPLGSLTPAEAPLIDAEKLFRQPRPPWTTNGTSSVIIPVRWRNKPREG